jgi:hypothetical protein
MKTSHKIALLALAWAVMMVSGCKSPEEKLIAHYENMTEILEEADEPVEGLEDFNDYMLSNGGEIFALQHEVAVELEGIEDKGDRKDRWEEHSKDLQSAKKDYREAKDDFIKDEVCDDSDARKWCKEYNKGWEKISEEAREKRDKVSGVSGYIRSCPEDEDDYSCKSN